MTTGELREGFFQECEDLLEALGDGLAQLDSGAAEEDTVHAVFRAVHSIKGGAAAFGLDALVSFAHAFENMLDAARSGQVALDSGALALSFRASDHLSDLVEAARSDGAPPRDTTGAALIAELDAMTGGRGGAGGADTPLEAAGSPDVTETAAQAPDAPAFTPLSVPLDLDAIGGDAATDPDPDAAPVPPNRMRYHIRFEPTRELYTSGNDPALLFRALSAHGELQVEMDLSALPPLSDLSWDDSYLCWNLTLDTDVPPERLREVFDFVEGCCRLDIRREGEACSAPGDPGDVRERAAPPEAVPAQGPQAVQGEAAASPRPGASPPDAPGEASAPAAVRPTIRVDLERVDRLINLVGELVITQAMLTQSIESEKLPPGNGVDSAMGQLRQLSSELQERVMAIRAQPIKPLFQRMSRIVRESAQAAGKEARLVTSGEDAEVDKTVIERLADPLTHMIRNAVDHGLEPPDARAGAGKPREGTVRLDAAHRSGRVIIELSDDGAGINRAKVREIAVQRGLIDPAKDLDDDEIDNLLFAPGFSTATEVSALSGRGVGMDVVKSEIQRLGGRVSIASAPGQGTTVSISLPLTLAVLEGMVVEIAGETLVVPTTALQETLKASGAEIQRIGARGWFLSIRGGFVPIVDVAAQLGFTAGSTEMNSRVLLLVESGNGRRAALAVDRVLDQREVVIKGLENNYGNVPGIAAATILGDGRIALIIDTDELTAGCAPGAVADRPLASKAGV